MIHDPLLAARSLRLPTQLVELRDDEIAMIALDLDDTLAHSAARAAALLEFGGQRLHIRGRQRQSADRGHALAGPTLGLPRHAHGGRLRGARRALRANAVANRMPAVGTQAAESRRVDDSRLHRQSV